MADASAEKNGYSGFERFLFFITPILFTAILLIVLLIIFNPSLREKAQKIGNQIPVINSLVPDVKHAEDPAQQSQVESVNEARQKLAELQALLSQRDAALKASDAKSVTQQKTIAELQEKIAALDKQSSDHQINQDAYQAKIRSLADMYGKMTPGKAAPIMESLTVEEAALVMGAMNDASRGRILEKMTPSVAADITMRLKDSDGVTNQQIAALQARVKELESRSKTASSSLDSTALASTFSSMDAASAAELLLQMSASEQTKTLRILSAMTNNARSSVLAAMSQKDAEKTASLVSKLVPANS
ncbi:MgtE protein [Cohnella hashimotonis]|uniref:MgtE protein n=1 Tax=Cohnella hashimotonis TaxID=2826895 RepID=A0ABT6THB4_9BACL|nr:MgtE protein [Cohnella hashimotonis]MDI4646219.1 MgtE protein [Cohnella hashimotonis]